MTESYYCEKCPENKYEDCGEWTENNSQLFKNVKQIHQNHKGWQKGKPKSNAKEELEKQANKTMENMIDEFADQYRNNKQEFIEEINEKFVFHSENAGKEITKQILNYKIITLRPLTYFQSDNTKMILVFLPTKKTVVKGKDENTSVQTEWINSAYFVISKIDSSGGNIREILPFDNRALAEKFRINVLPEWNDIRWDILDLTFSQLNTLKQNLHPLEINIYKESEIKNHSGEYHLGLVFDKEEEKLILESAKN